MNSDSASRNAAASPNSPRWEKPLPARDLYWFVSAGLLTLSCWAAAAAAAPPAPTKPGEVFLLTNVWTVHLQFRRDQWDAMEPKGGPSGLGGFGRRGGWGGRGGLGGLEPGNLLTPVFLKAGDQNQDGRLSKQEFQALAAKWFGEWARPNSTSLTVEQLRAGVAATFLSQNGDPSGAGGRLGRGPGLNLQGAAGQRNGLAAAMGIEFEYVRADLEFAGRRMPDVAVRYKGNGTFLQSRGSFKRSLKVDLNKYVTGQNLAGLTKLNFHNNVTDASWMNEVLSHRLFRDAGVPAPRTAYARVYVSVVGLYNREYFGLYSLVEDLDKHFAAERFGTKKGALFKPVTRDLLAYLGEDWAAYQQTYDPKTDLTVPQQRRVIEFARLVTSSADAEFASKLGSFLDLDEFARFLAVTVWLSTLDSILVVGQNYYVYLHPETDRFQFLPWDLDHSFGQFPLVGTHSVR